MAKIVKIEQNLKNLVIRINAQNIYYNIHTQIIIAIISHTGIKQNAPDDSGFSSHLMKLN